MRSHCVTDPRAPQAEGEARQETGPAPTLKMPLKMNPGAANAKLAHPAKCASEQASGLEEEICAGCALKCITRLHLASNGVSRARRIGHNSSLAAQPASHFRSKT